VCTYLAVIVQACFLCLCKLSWYARPIDEYSCVIGIDALPVLHTG
jgi:hypothetical protein